MGSGGRVIDIHCHILPNVDDGAKNVQDSIEMAKEAVKEGIHSIIATPHHRNGSFENTKSLIVTEVEKLNTAFKNENIPLTIFPGQETRIYGEILNGMDSNEIQTLNNSQYLFIELPSSHVPRYTEQLLYDIQIKGFIPIIVHPERNQEFHEHPDLLYRLVKNGSLTQVTASSVAGYFGKKVKNFSLQLIDANLTHFVSSDAHNISNRTFKMVESFDVIEKKYDIDMVYMFKENAELLLEGNHVFKEIPERVSRKKFLGIF